MIRLFEYNTPTVYKDFEDYIFSLYHPVFDFEVGKVTIYGIDYRLSSIVSYSHLQPHYWESTKSGEQDKALTVIAGETISGRSFVSMGSDNRCYLATYQVINGIASPAFAISDDKIYNEGESVKILSLSGTLVGVRSDDNDSIWTAGKPVYLAIDGKVTADFGTLDNQNIAQHLGTCAGIHSELGKAILLNIQPFIEQKTKVTTIDGKKPKL